MEKILVTGAAGGIGTRLRKLLKGVYPSIRWSDHPQARRSRAPMKTSWPPISPISPQVEKIVAGVDGIVHLGGYSIEGPWDTILQRQHRRLLQSVRGGLPRRRQARGVRLLQSRRRLLSARASASASMCTVRPDSRYGVSKAFGEALGALYADKHGLRVTCLRIGNVGDAPVDQRRLAIWLKPRGPGAAHPHRAGASRHPLRDLLRRLRQCRQLGGTTAMPAATATSRKARPSDFLHAGDGGAGQVAARPGRRPLSGRAVLQRRIRRRPQSALIDRRRWPNRPTPLRAGHAAPFPAHRLDRLGRRPVAGGGAGARARRFDGGPRRLPSQARAIRPSPAGLRRRGRRLLERRGREAARAQCQAPRPCGDRACRLRAHPAAALCRTAAAGRPAGARPASRAKGRRSRWSPISSKPPPSNIASCRNARRAISTSSAPMPTPRAPPA